MNSGVRHLKAWNAGRIHGVVRDLYPLTVLDAAVRFTLVQYGAAFPYVG
jgi:hypothetical protein